MNQAGARRFIWEILARECSEYEDSDCDALDGSRLDEPDRRRIAKAAKQVASTIRRKLARAVRS